MVLGWNWPKEVFITLQRHLLSMERRFIHGHNWKGKREWYPGATYPEADHGWDTSWDAIDGNICMSQNRHNLGRQHIVFQKRPAHLRAQMSLFLKHSFLKWNLLSTLCRDILRVVRHWKKTLPDLKCCSMATTYKWWQYGGYYVCVLH